MYGSRCMMCAMRETKNVCPDAKSDTGSTPAIRLRPSLVLYIGISRSARALPLRAPPPPRRSTLAKSTWSQSFDRL